MTQYLFLFFSQAVPHGRHNLWHLPKRGTGVLTFNCCLGVPEEKGICWNRLLWFIGVFLLPSFLVARHPRQRDRCGLLRPTSLGCCWGHRRYRDRLGSHVWRCSRWRQWHGGVDHHTPLEKTRKNERRRVSKHGIGDASVQCNPGHPHLKVIHFLILQWISRWWCCRQKLLSGAWMVPNVFSPKSQYQLRVANGGQVTALQKPMTNITKMDINCCGGRMAEVWTPRIPQFL